MNRLHRKLKTLKHAKRQAKRLKAFDMVKDIDKSIDALKANNLESNAWN